MSQDSRRDPERPVGRVQSPIVVLGRREFTLVELGTVCLIVAVLLGVAIPAFHSSWEKMEEGRATGMCMSHMKRLGLAVLSYMQDNDDTYPVCNRTYLASSQNDPNSVRASWMRHILPYVAKTPAPEGNGKWLGMVHAVEAFSCPATVRPDDKQTLLGSGGNRKTGIALPRRDIGANGLLFHLSEDPTGREAQSISQHDLGRPERLPIIADSSACLWTDPRYLTFSSYVSKDAPTNDAAWAKDLTDRDIANPNPAYARHHGGVNLIFGDGHTLWLPQSDLGMDPSRNNESQELNYKLPFVPIDRIDRTTGAVTLPQDDRLR